MYFVGLFGDTDGTFRRRKRLVSGQKAETLGLFLKQHGAEIPVTETDLALFGNGTGDTKRL
ncbi:hypothetical protein SDC9_181730 [bioreactor metagenome]|uniref:Uncharacterized protein n=1 Tax=bioreactor metagenome TaxID=1076179 RepID=A0A645H5F2_9ZZZZ